MRLLGSTKKDVDKDKNSKNVPKLESVEIALVHCNLVKKHIKRFIQFCSEQTIWTVDKYFTTFFNDDEYS